MAEEPASQSVVEVSIDVNGGMMKSDFLDSARLVGLILNLAIAFAVLGACTTASPMTVLPGVLAHASKRPTIVPQPAASGFITVAASDLSSLTIPTAYMGTAVDTSGWDQYDVTCECVNDACVADDTGVSSCVPASGTIPFFNSWGCAEMDDTGTTDNTTDFRCLMHAISDNDLLFFPDGTYDFSTNGDGNSVFRPSPTYDNRGIIFESRAAIVNIVGIYPDDGTLVFLEAEDAVWVSGAPATTWSGTRTAGSTVLTVASTTGFSTTPGAAGHWVVLNADPTSIQSEPTKVYRSTVSAIGAGTITIDHPLPSDFSGANATARAWTPTENWVLRGGTLQFESPNHLSDQGINFNVSFKNVVDSEISDMALKGGYRQYLNFEDNADLYIAGNDMTESKWDKSVNAYAMVVSGSSRLTIFDNHVEHVTGIAMTGGTEETLIIYNDFRGPTVVPSNDFDVGCDQTIQSPPQGGANDCNLSTLITHTGHGTTQGTAYLHCSSGSETDALGFNGDASCRGTAATVIYSCAEWHNASSSTSLFMRNYCQGPVWYDNNNGNGRDNFMFGNWMGDSPSGLFDTAHGGDGDFHYLDSAASLPAGYRRNDIWANNYIQGIFGSGSGWNVYCDGCEVHDNVIVDSCIDTDDTDVGGGPDGGDCTHTPSGLVDGTNVTWANNTVGATSHSGYSRTMPTLPGFTELPTFSITPTVSAPYVGPEMGVPSTVNHCVPAAERFYGSGNCS